MCCLGRQLQRWPLRWRAPPCGTRPRVCCLGRWLQGRCRARSTRATLASTLARATPWREAARVLPRAAASRSLLCSLNAGNAGFLRWREPPCGARRRMCCLGRWLQVAAVLAQRRQRWLLRWREPPCGAGRRDCCLGRRLQGRCRARLTRAALASTLALATLWRGRRMCCLRRSFKDAVVLARRGQRWLLRWR